MKFLRNMIGVVLSVSIVLSASVAVAVTKYVDGTIANCASTYNSATRLCSGGSSTSYQTIESGIANLGASNTLIIRSGAYSGVGELAPAGGTVSNPTTIKNQPGEAFTWTKTSGSHEYLIYLSSGQNYVTFTCDAVVNCEYNSALYNSPDDPEGGVFQSFGSSNIVVENSTIHGSLGNCVYADKASTNWTVRGNNIYTCGMSPNAPYRGHAIYFEGDNHLIEHNEMHDTWGVGIHCYSGFAGNTCDNGTFRHNKIYNIAKGALTQLAAIVLDGHNNTAYRNTIRCGNSAGVDSAFQQGIQVYAFTSGNNDNLIYHNSITRCGVAIDVEGGANSLRTLVKNNLMYLNTNALIGNSNGTSANNQSTNPSWIDSDNNNFGLQAGSSAIDAGVNIGFAFNGSAPDIGAHETFTGSPSCVVENATPSKLSITFVNNLNPPVLPASPAFGTNKFTARKATIDNPVTAATRTGTNQIDLTLTNAIVNGNAVDFSYSTTAGDLTDSALIGGSSSQRLNAITNQSCTNNVGAAAAYVLTQAAFAWHGVRGTEAAPVSTPYASAPESSNIVAVPGALMRLRISITCTTADCPPLGFIPYYSRNAGSYTLIPDVYGADNLAFCGTSPDSDIPASGTSTTSQLTTGGAFVAGAIVRTSNAVPTIDMALNGKTELEYCLAFNSTVVAGDTYDIRVRKQDTTVVDAYTTTPRVTVMSSSSGSGF